MALGSGKAYYESEMVESSEHSAHTVARLPR